MKFVFRFLIAAALLAAIVLYYMNNNGSNTNNNNEILLNTIISNIDGAGASQRTSAIIRPSYEFDRQIWEKIAMADKRNDNVTGRVKFKPLTDANLVIVVQVHKRIEYLRALINSMKNVQKIEETLLVFSHDFYDEQMNQLISSIHFAPVIQIFFPFSTQLWSNTFPGTSPNDCSRDLTKKEAIAINCSNAKYPDTYGHYREAHITQTKHHWWWKANYVFDQLPITMHHNGQFLFLEEDHFLAPDFLHTWNLMRKVQKLMNQKDGKHVDILTLGNYDEKFNAKLDCDKLQFTEWISTKHNMAFTVDRNLWNKLKLCSAEFCTYDDYNWDWTLQHVIQNCFDDMLLTLMTVVPRAYHLGTCGVHHHSADCAVVAKEKGLQDIFASNRKHFFPDDFKVQKREEKKMALKNNGGWNDPRDHQLCLQYEHPFERIVRSNSNFARFRSILLFPGFV